mmetsp:Transcript_23659/g.23411  ORF Transcript_23659/g.23411 Transcript_23659/m.23411 type:complete len:439 (+) Transcript_23659:203-1519(+)
MLPFLILNAGYNLKRKRFFKNIGPIFLFGIGGTLTAFIVIGLEAYLFSEMGLIIKDGKTYHIPLQDGLLIGAVLSSTDIVCTLAMVKEDKTPKLFSILLGESVSNDAIGILLVQTLSSMDLSNIGAAEFGIFIGKFLYNCFTSTICGSIFGVVTTYMTRRFKSLRDDPSKMIGLFLYISWIGYTVAELLGISGVICILVASIISGHYSFYNMTPSSRIACTEFMHFIGDAAEALIFAYLGLTTLSYDVFSVSWVYLFFMIIGVLIARFCGTFGLSFLARFISRGKHKLTIKQLAVCWMGGIIRGAVSFALVLTLDGENEKIMKMTVLALVIVTTLVFGVVLPLWVWWVDPKEEDVVTVDAQQVLGDLAVGHNRIVITKADSEERGWFHRTWRNFDNKYIKPFLIDPVALEEARKIKATIKSLGRSSVGSGGEVHEEHH